MQRKIEVPILDVESNSNHLEVKRRKNCKKSQVFAQKDDDLN
jgi:hypothetical protein